MVPRIYRDIANLFPQSWSSFPVAVMHYKKNWDIIRQSHQIIKNHMKETTDKSTLTFYKNLMQYSIWFEESGTKYLESYFTDGNIDIIKMENCNILNNSKVIMICCVYNDINRIKQLIEHHRKIGIKHMVFVDNMSDDGTYEWLCKQNVDLFRTGDRFHAGAKAAWVRKIQEIYGFNRWYLVVDSDEFFRYIGMEQHDINEVILYAERNGLSRIGAFMLEMYTKGCLYQKSVSPEFEKEYRYFDNDSYDVLKDYKGTIVMGGPRERVFDKKVMGNRYKYPLVRLKKEEVWHEHYSIPFKNNYKSPCLAVLSHYKFMDGDYERYEHFAKSGQYANNSIEIKNYVDNGKDITFFYERSKEYISSQSLKQLSFVKDMFE